MSRSPRAEGFSKRHRFHARGSFAVALRSARKVRGDTLIVHAAAARTDAAKLGIALTRRLVPLAHQRNLLRRLVREVFRRHEVKSRGLDCVVALRRPFDPAAAPALRDELRGLFDQLTAR